MLRPFFRLAATLQQRRARVFKLSRPHAIASPSATCEALITAAVSGVNSRHTGKAALRALKRRISDVVYRHLVADARRATRTR
jgi:hypothetical protein